MPLCGALQLWLLSISKKSIAEYTRRMSPIPFIEIRGARTHNLQNVDLDIPRGKWTVITGVSGSGKSSLAFDTLFAEAQRQYLQSLSTYARQFVDQLERPSVDSIRYLQPALCIDQRQGTLSPRSTVGTVTEIYDFLRLLMARVATPACHQCGDPIDRQSPAQIEHSLRELPDESRLTIMAPMVIGRKGAHADLFSQIGKAGIVKVRVDGTLYELEEVPALAVRKEHTIEAIVDRLIVRPESHERIGLAVQQSLRLSHGLVAVRIEQKDAPESIREQLFSTRFACLRCGISLVEVEPRTFSFNSPFGACPRCEGFGAVSHDELAMGRKTRTNSNTEGATDSSLERNIRCPECQGERLRPESLAIRLEGRSIADIAKMPLEQAVGWLLERTWSDRQAAVARPILHEICQRMQFLLEVGLGYLTLDRDAQSLSGGELQRVRLASSIGTGLIGVCYVLDEPSIGLHPRDTQRLIGTLRSLQAKGNTIVVVEHDEQLMLAADHLVDVGVGAGKHGGRILGAGNVECLVRNPESLTGQYLSGERSLDERRSRNVDANHPCLSIRGVTRHNLSSVDAHFPIGRLVGVTGVSGSGKSTLVHDALAGSIRSRLLSGPWPSFVGVIEGLEAIDRLIEMDQSPIGRSPRSIPATYVGFWDEIRKTFAKTREAKQRGYSAARFSFNAGDGRCDLCSGQGRLKMEMNFLPDTYVGCPRCKGDRFARSTLAVRYHGKTISDCLEMSVEEASQFFENFPSIHRPLQCMLQVGLGYMALGQPANTLSGGEAQRIKLACELSKPSAGRTLYLFDEPTTGLHMDDIAKLVRVFHDLVDRGNTVIVIEHHLGLIRCCDWVIDLGPDGGVRGGTIVATGTPTDIALRDCPTGIALRGTHS